MTTALYTVTNANQPEGSRAGRIAKAAAPLGTALGLRGAGSYLTLPQAGAFADHEDYYGRFATGRSLSVWKLHMFCRRALAGIGSGKPLHSRLHHFGLARGINGESYA